MIKKVSSTDIGFYAFEHRKSKDIIYLKKNIADA
jgi:hypothetical protein